MNPADKAGSDELAGADVEPAVDHEAAPSRAWLYISARSALSSKSNEPTVIASSSSAVKAWVFGVDVHAASAATATTNTTFAIDERLLMQAPTHCPRWTLSQTGSKMLGNAMEVAYVTKTQARWVRRRADWICAVAGLAVLGLGMIAVRNGTVTGFEKSIFRAINDLPQALYRPLWPLQQAGNLLVGPVVALVALVLGYRRLAAAALVVTVMKLVLERSSRRW